MTECTYNKYMRAWIYMTNEFVVVISHVDDEDGYYSYVIYTNDEKHEAVYRSVDDTHEEYFYFVFDAIEAAKNTIDITL